jgi:repressor of nif and glnA expression
MSRLQDDIRHETERGVLLLILILNDLDWMPVKALQKQIVGQGYLLSIEDLRFHLNYLEQEGLVERRQLRAGRTDLELETVRATTKAVDLHDGRIAPHPGVAF